MSVEIKQLKENNVGFYPLTVGEAVILDNDVTVSAKISELESNSGSSVKYTNQSLTEDQKMQARKNQDLYRKITHETFMWYNGPYYHAWDSTESFPFVGTYNYPEIPENPTSESPSYIEWNCDGYFDLSRGEDLSNISFTGGTYTINNGYQESVIVEHKNGYDILGNDLYHVKEDGVNIGTTNRPKIMNKGLWYYASGFIHWFLEEDGGVYQYTVDNPEGFFEWAISSVELEGIETEYIKVPNQYLPITNVVSNSNTEIPSAKAVKTYVDANASAEAVKYTTQSLTEEQQTQSRKNQGLYYEEVSPAGTIEWDGTITDRDWFEHIAD